MSEWWSYSLSDFLMFSPRIYWRLVEQYNRDAWPGQLVALAVGAGCVGLARRASVSALRAMTVLLAVAWASVAWAFHWERHATINLAAPYFAAGCALQALLLLALACTRLTSAPTRTGCALAVAGLALYPFLGLAFDRPLAQAEVFGLMPEPTALVTLGLLARSWHLCVIPMLSLSIGFALLYVMG